MWTILLIIVAVIIAIGAVPKLRRGFFNTAFGQEMIMIVGFLAVGGAVYLVGLFFGIW